MGVSDRGGDLGRRRVRPPGELIEVDDLRLHVVRQGIGSPPVVLESGERGTALHWHLVASRLSARSRVVAYDRAGRGWSDPGPRPRTVRRCADELLGLLENLGTRPDRVLVGHGYGALVVREVATCRVDEVGGVVLIDPLDASVPRGGWLGRLFHRLGGSVRRSLEQPALDALPEHVRDVLASAPDVDGPGPEREGRSGEDEDAGTVRGFPDVPTAVVLSGERSRHRFRSSLGAHRRLLAHVGTTRFYVTRTSGFGPLLVEPDLVAAAVRWVQEQVLDPDA